jgi:hypothetical protein
MLVQNKSIAQVIANDDDFLVNENEIWTGNLGENDALPLGQAAVYSVVEGPSLGTFIFTTGGNFEYTPPLNQFGFRDSVYYQVCVNGQCDIAGVEFYVIFRNTIPFAGNDYFSVELNTPRIGDVTTNDGDPDSLTDPIDPSLQWYKLSNPANGIVNSFSITGTFTYTPNNGFSGTDSFTYYVVDHCGLYVVATVYLTMVAPNSNPIAGNQTIGNLNEDQTYGDSLAPLVSDPENDAITFSIVNAPSFGNLQLNSNGGYTYTPLPNFTGTVNFTYSACDVVGQCAQGSITLTFNNTDNDPPQLVGDFLMINEDSSASINAALNDYDDTGTLTYSILSQPSNGLAALLGSSGQISYTPNPNFFGSDSFVLQACDGLQCANSIISVQINGINDIPVASPFILTLLEDTNSGGTMNTITDAESFPLNYSFLGGPSIPGLTLNTNGSFSYAAPPNYFGTQIAQIQGCDGQGECATTTFTLTVNSFNDLPIASNDSFAVGEDQIITGNLSNGEFDVEGSLLTYTATSTASHGLLSVSSNGQFTYTPNENWFGSETVSIAVCDDLSGCTNTTLSLTINPINDVPIALPAGFTINEDVNFNGSVSSFVSDVESTELTFSLLSAPNTGNLVLNTAGSFTYSAPLNYFGILNYTYQVCDNAGSCAIGTLTLNIAAINDSPVAPNVAINLNEDETASGILNNIQDVDNPNLVLSIIQNTLHGNFVLNNNGNYTYTPDLNYFGNDTIVYAACDAQNACSQGYISITIQPVEDTPQIISETLLVEEGNTLINSVSANDIDGDGDPLVYTALNSAANGIFSLNSNGAFIYTPNNLFVGTESIAYSACDNQGNCATAFLTILVLTTNTPPSASNSTQSLQEDQTIEGVLSDLIIDTEGGPYSFTILNAPQHGLVQLEPSGNFMFVPQIDYFGSDSFTYQVCDAGGLCASASVQLSIAAVNDAPTLVEDEIYLLEDFSFSIDISENDSDPESNSFNYSLTTPSEYLQTTLLANGQLTILPIANFFGFTNLEYTCCDDQGACSSGILNLFVNPIFDSPVALSQLVITSEDQTVDGVLNAMDIDSEVLTFGAFSSPTNGTLTMESTGSFNYTPAENFAGTDQFIYFAADITGMYDTSVVFIQINPVNDAPVATSDTVVVEEDGSVTFNIATNDYDSENQSISYTQVSSATLGTFLLSSDGLLEYTPYSNANGIEQLNVTLCDSENACTSDIITFVIHAVNDNPFSEGFTFSSPEDEIVIGNLQEVASDIEDTLLSIEITEVIENGNWVLGTNGSFAFYPTANYFGTQTISFLACDYQGSCTSGEFQLTIEPVNDTPQTSEANYTLSEDSATEGNLLASIIDPDNESTLINVVQDVQHGTFLLNTDGTFVYAPVANYFGSDSLIYSACDTNGSCSIGIVYFDVTFLNDLPIVQGEQIQVILNTSISGSLALNDEELDAEPLVYSVVNDLSGGSFQLNADGTYSYIPATDTIGLFSVEYAACDPCNACDYGTIFFFVVSEEEANTPPSAMNYVGEICQGGSISINLINLISDTEETQQELNLSFGTANSGNYQLDAETQELIYHASTSSLGQIIIPYYVCDNGIISMCDTAEIQLTIIPLNNIEITGFSIEQISCYGTNDGSVIVSAQTEIGALSYTWSSGAGTSSIDGLSPGTYSLVISSDAQCSVNQTAQFEIFEPDQLTASYQVISAEVGSAEADSIVITFQGGTPGYVMSWNTPNGIIANQSAVAIEAEGTYTFTITDANGCSYTESVIIAHTEEALHEDQLQLFPNPLADGTLLQLKSNTTIAMIQVLDSKGALIETCVPNDTEVSIETSDWSSGIYTLRIHRNGDSQLRRIFKQ